MFGFFYPENNQRFLESVSFDTAQEAIAYWRDKRAMWQELTVMPVFAGGNDLAAWLNPMTGDIVVVREIHAS